jgi:hypothetical protein
MQCRLQRTAIENALPRLVCVRIRLAAWERPEVGNDVTRKSLIEHWIDLATNRGL